MATTITTTTGTASPTQYNHQRKLDRCANGVEWALIHNSNSSRLEFWFSSNNGSTWTEDTSQRISDIANSAGGSMRIATRADGNERLGVCFVKNDRVRVNLGRFANDRLSFSWQQSNVIASTSGNSATWNVPDLELVPLGSSWVMAVFWSRLASGKAYLWWNRLKWGESGTATVSSARILHTRVSTIHTRPSVAIRHLGDDEFVYTAAPDLYVAWAQGAVGNIEPRQYMMRMTSRGTTWDMGIVRVLREAGVLPSATAAAFTGKAFVAVRTPYADGTEDPTSLQMHVMDPADAVREAIDVPALGGGNVVNVGLSWDNYSGDIYILAAGASNQNPKYIKYLWATRQFDAAWTTINIEGANDGSISVKPGSRHNRIEFIYSIVSGANRAAKHELATTTNTLPSTATWVTTSGTKNRAASLFLQWQHNDVDGDIQSAYTLERRVNAGTAEYWNGATWQASLINVTSATQSVTLSSGWATAGDTIDYRVRTSDAVSFGPWSATLPILAATIVNPTITSPSAGANLTSTPVSVTWTVAEQTAFRVRLLQGSFAVYDSDWIGELETRSYEIPFELINGAAYTIEVTTENLSGFASTPQTVNVTVSLLPPPVPVLTLTAIPASGAIDVGIGNGTLLNSNVGFEVDLTQWQGTSGGVTRVRSTEQAHSGVASYKITPNGTDATVQGFTLAGLFAATSGRTYSGRVFSYAPDGWATTQVVLDFRTGADVSTGTVSSTLQASPAGEWVEHYITGIAPATTTNVRLFVQATGTPPASAIIYWDDAEVREAALSGQDAADNNDIYRMDMMGEEMLIAQFIDANTTFRDFSVAHAMNYTYRVVARTSAGATISTA